MNELLALSAGFLAGGFARWLLAGAIYARLGAQFPWGTAVVNMTGCLAIGLIDGATAGRLPLAAAQRLALMTGFCGAYTTFSALILETSGLLSAGRYGAAALYYLGGGALGLALFRLGSLVAR